MAASRFSSFSNLSPTCLRYDQKSEFQRLACTVFDAGWALARFLRSGAFVGRGFVMRFDFFIVSAPENTSLTQRTAERERGIRQALRAALVLRRQPRSE